MASSKGALARRLSQLGCSSEAALRDFSGKESGQLVILPPRPVLITDAQPEIDALFQELVGDELEPRRRRTKRRPDIEAPA